MVEGTIEILLGILLLTRYKNIALVILSTTIVLITIDLFILHYYNLAIDLINKKNYYDAFKALKKANILYPESQRIKDFLWFTNLKYESELSTFVNN